MEFALFPDQFERYIESDFGWEDRYFLIGKSETDKDFPYVLPGPVDTWGGTWPTSGWRTSEINILFGIETVRRNADYKLVIELTDFSKKFLPLMKVTVNGQEDKFQMEAEDYELASQRNPGLNEKYDDNKPVRAIRMQLPKPSKYRLERIR
jgi:hypothetical protein